MRGELEAALAALQAVSPDRAVRARPWPSSRTQADEGKLVLIEKAIAAETDAA
jgi:urea transport system permease protein